MNKNTSKFYDRAKHVTESTCAGLVKINVGGIDQSHNASERNCDDLGPLRHYNYQIRCSAGNDNAGRNNRCNRNPQQQNGRPANRGRRPIWGDQDGPRLPPLRLVFRDPSLAQSAAQPTPSRIPVPCPHRPEPLRRQDRPVELYTGSRLPVPNRPGRAPPRIPRNNDRLGTYDVQPPRPCPLAAAPADRRGTYDVQPPPCGDQNSRRCSFTVQQPEARGSCPVQDNRRATYDVPQPFAVPQCSRRSSCNAQPQPTSAGVGNTTGSFTMTGTIRLDGFQGLSPVRPPGPRDRSSSCSRLQDNNNSGIDDFLDNPMNVDMVAPRSMAVPGQPYVRIDETAGNTTPEQWRQMIDNRSSIGSQPMGIMSPTYDDYRGSRDTSADSPRLQRWSSADRHSRPFGLDDSFVLSGASTPCERPSRARSAAPDCGLPVRKSHCRRRDTFDRNTR